MLGGVSVCNPSDGARKKAAPEAGLSVWLKHSLQWITCPM